MRQAEYIPHNRLTGAECTPGQGGTIGFLAPEQEVEGGRYGQKIDAFARGRVGIWLFTGRPLFRFRHNPFPEPLGNVAPSKEMAKWMELYKKALAQLGGARRGSIQNLLQAMLQGVP